ncbi:hypothetical protein MKW98_016479, partial [Papaver atlanticum]
IYNQPSIGRVMGGSQSEEVTILKERETESVGALPEVAKLVDENDAGKAKKKASLSDLVEPEEELDKEKEPMKARKPRKIMKKSEKKVDKVQGGAAKEKEGHHNIEFDEEKKDKSKEEEEIVVVPIVEGSLASGLKRKVTLDNEEYPKKVKKLRKVLKKSKEKGEEVQGDAAKKEEEDKSKEEEEIVVVPMVKESKNAKRSKKKFVNKDDAETPELLQIYNQASITCVMEVSQSEEVTNCPERAVESVAALPKVAKLVHENDAGKPKKKASSSDLVEPEEELEKEKESMKARKPRKIWRKSEKKVDNEQGGATKKEKGDLHSIEYDEEENDKSKEEEEIVVGPIVGKVLEGNLASGLKRKVALDKEEDPKKVKKPRKVLKKSKKKVEEMQGDAAKKEEEDKSKEEEEIVVVPMVEESKITKRPKKKFVNKDDVETPELLQVSNMRANEDSQSEEVTFCPERATESVAPLPKVAEVVDKNQVGKLKKKASSSDLVEQEEELEKGEESKTAKKPRKILKRSKQKVEELQDGTLMKEKRGHSNTEFDGEEKDKCEEEKEIVAVPMGGRVLEGSQVSALKRKITLDTGEDFKKIKKPKKVLKMSKKKSEEVLGDARKNEEKDKSKEEKEIVVIPMDENASEDSQARLLMRKVVLDKVQESHKVKKPKKVSKKAKKKIEELQGSAKKEEMDKGKEVKEIADIPLVKNVFEDSQGSVPIKVASVTVEELKNAKRLKKKLVIKYDVETAELLQASNMRAKEDSQSEEVTLCPERATESVVALPKVTKVVDKSEAGKHKKKTSSRDLVEQEEELEKEEESRTSKNPTKILKRSKKKVEEVQGGAAIKEKRCHPNTEFDEEEKDKFEDEKEIVAVPMAGKVSEGTQVSPMKKKVALDKEEDLRKVKKLKKVLKKSKKKVEELQGDATKMEEGDKSKEKDEIPAVPTVENVSEDFQASVPHEETCFQLSGKLEESQKAKKNCSSSRQITVKLLMDGFYKAVMTVKKGEVALVTIMPEYAFGSSESHQELAVVPPGSTVYYEVELVSFVKVGWEDNESWIRGTWTMGRKLWLLAKRRCWSLCLLSLLETQVASHPPVEDFKYKSYAFVYASGRHTPSLQFPRTKEIHVNGTVVRVKYCSTCMFYRPSRCSHCSICINCVENSVTTALG